MKKSDSDCIFCKIQKQEVPTKLLFEDGDIIAFDDKFPAAPCHFLVVPREHIESLDSVNTSTDHKALMGKMVTVAVELAKKRGLSAGYRLVVNCGEEGGQVVQHLHLHVLGGTKLGKMG